MIIWIYLKKFISRCIAIINFHVTVILGSAFFLGVSSWVNHYDAPFTFTCPQHQSISRVRSHHDNGAEDRVFDFQCKQYTSDSESCHWSGESRDKMLYLFKKIPLAAIDFHSKIYKSWMLTVY